MMPESQSLDLTRAGSVSRGVAQLPVAVGGGEETLYAFLKRPFRVDVSHYRR